MADTKKMGERLIEAGLITPDSLNRALELQKKQQGLRLGDCLLALRLISEQALLRFLAAEYQTRYVSAEKLSKVKVASEVLDRVPVRMAEALCLVPLLYDAERKIMSIVIAEPQNTAAIEELKILTGLSEVYVYVGARSAIQAAIKKHYYGDPTAFDMLDLGAPPQVAPTEAGAVAAALDSGSRTDQRSAPSGAFRFETNPAVKSGSVRTPAPRANTNIGASPTSVRAAIDVVQRSSLMSDNDFIETLNVLVGLIEMRRKDAFRGHSAAVAKHSRTIAQRMGLQHREVGHVTVAAYLHDLGKRADRHFTLVSVAQDAEWKAEARRYYKAPIKLFETVHLPVQVNSILAQLFEAYDGSGLPQGSKAEAIPAGARIIAAVDAFEDLTKNAQNVFNRQFSKHEALELMQERSGTLFDPAVLDIMRQIHTGEILRERLVSDGRQVMVCHADEGMRTDLRDALSRRQVVANVVASADGILDAVRSGEADLVIAQLEPESEHTLSIVALLRQEPATAGIPVIFIAPAVDASLDDRVQALAPAALFPGTADPEEIATKAREMLDDHAAHGAPGRVVSGMLDEMDLASLLKTAAEASRSGKLQIRGLGKQGEIFIEKGRIVHAVAGTLKADAAFDDLSTIDHGDFALDPNALILEQSMDKDIAVLLRESQSRRKRAS
ncbi:MAG: HD domain-containing phosphohydrolase [Myxococcales bacterium]